MWWIAGVVIWSAVIMANTVNAFDGRLLLVWKPLLILISLWPLSAIVLFERWFKTRTRIGKGVVMLIAAIGLSSYSLYLLHEPLIDLRNMLQLASRPGFLREGFQAIWFMVVLMACWLSYREVELRFMKKPRQAPLIENVPAIGKAVNTICAKGGLLVAPSGTCFARLQHDSGYRQAVTSANLALADSGLMVMLWRILRRERISRISGLAYLKELIKRPEVRQSGVTFWILPNAAAQAKAESWAVARGFRISSDECYVAPFYGAVVKDETLVAMLGKQPRHIIIAIGAGAQEKLGFYLREQLGYRPAIHCIGGALGFLTGDQIGIPGWIDRLYLGWFLRLLTRPRVFIPRLWKARILPSLIVRYGRESPPLQT
jgi:N-acetylglucosaminyldiphosphoundecaprenol N-acetyl-beta-D-mannosaminyltransferase